MSNDIASQLESILTDYEQEVDKITMEVLEEQTEDFVKELKSTTPTRTGKTAKGWTYRQEGDGYRVYNTNYYPIHLIEYGTYRASPQPFVRPAFSKVSESLINELEKKLKE